MDDNAETKAVSAKMVAFISLSPESTYSTEEVRRLHTKERNCYFPDEIKLNYTQKYSYTNCLAECRSTLAFKICGCVPYHMANNGMYPICQMNQLSCILSHRGIYNGALPGLNATVLDESKLNIKETPCKCLPDCELNQYPSEITSAYFNRSFAFSFSSF